MGEPQGALSEPLYKGNPHLRFPATCRALQDTVFRGVQSVHSGLLVIVEWNIYPAIRHAQRDRKRALKGAFFCDTVRQVSERPKWKNQGVAARLVQGQRCGGISEPKVHTGFLGIFGVRNREVAFAPHQCVLRGVLDGEDI